MNLEFSMFSLDLRRQLRFHTHRVGTVFIDLVKQEDMITNNLQCVFMVMKCFYLRRKEINLFQNRLMDNVPPTVEDDDECGSDWRRWSEEEIQRPAGSGIRSYGES